MRTDTKKRNVISSGAVLESANYEIDQSNIVHITTILRGMYSRPDLAVIREYGSNARDTHVLNGISRPVEIHVPTYDEPWYSIRDFATGLSPEDTKRFLYGYGASGQEKRESNQYIGGFGIGCKCAFALCDSFTYTIWHKGTKCIWVCSLDERDCGKADMVLSEPDPTTPSGIEVNVPLSVTDGTSQEGYLKIFDEVYAFQDSIHHPKFINSEHTIPEVPQADINLQMDTLIDNNPISFQLSITPRTSFPDSLDDYSDEPLLLVGGTPYAVDTNELDLDPVDPNAISEELRTLLLNQSVIHAPVGFVQLAPSRESLQYSALTKKVLATTYNKLLTEKSMDAIQDQIKNKSSNLFVQLQSYQMLGMPTPRQSKNICSTGFKYPKNYDVLAQYSLDYTAYGEDELGTYSSDGLWSCQRNFPTSETDFMADSTKKHFTLECISAGRRHQYPYRSRSQTDTTLPIVIKIPAGTINADIRATVLRALTYKAQLRKQSGQQTAVNWSVLVITSSATATPDWMTDGSVSVYDDPGKQLPADYDQKLVFKKSVRRSSYRGGGGNGSQSYSQHSRKFVSLRDNHNDTMSQRWNAETAKTVNSGVYVTLDRFAICDTAARGRDDKFYGKHNSVFDALQSLFGQTTEKEKIDLRTHLQLADLLPEVGGDKPLYGIRRSDEHSIVKDPDFITLWAYIHNRFTEAVTADTIKPDGLIFGILKEIWESDEKTGMAFTNMMTFMRRIAERPELVGTELARRALYWDRAQRDCKGDTKAWGTFLGHMGCVLDHGSGISPQCHLDNLIQRHQDIKANGRPRKSGIIDWSLLDCDDGRDMNKVWVNGEGYFYAFYHNTVCKDSNNRMAHGATTAPRITGAEMPRLLHDLQYLAKHHPGLVHALGLHHMYPFASTKHTLAGGYNKDELKTEWKFLANIQTGELGKYLMEQEHFYEYLASSEQNIDK